jgi:hypothetical protein
LLSEVLEPAVVVDLLLHLGRVLGGHALAELLAVKVTLQHEIGALAATFGLEELLAQRATAEVVDGLHVPEDLFAFLSKGVNFVCHGRIVSLQIQYASKKVLLPEASAVGLLWGHTPIRT